MPTNSEGLGTGIEENPIGFSSPDVIDREGLSVFVLSIDACRRASFLGGGGGGASGEERGCEATWDRRGREKAAGVSSKSKWILVQFGCR